MTPYDLIPARPTTYRGIQMRSRLEARFAAEADRAEAEWQYEPRAFADQSGQYLPDFMLGREDTYVEVRPTRESALRARAQMDIIRSSIPSAYLWIVVPDEQLCFSSLPGDEGRWHERRGSFFG